MTSPNETIDLARSQLGTHSPDNTTPYNLEYGLSGPGAAWCQMFVWWCLSHSGVDTIRTAWTPSGIAYYESLGRWTGGANLDGAQPGDVLYFDYDNVAGQRTDHVGFIESIDDTTVQTIEGNVGGGYVKRLWHRRGASYIVGYGRPLYDAAAAPAPAPIAPPQPDTSRDVVRERQAWLNQIGIDAGPVDGIVGPRTTAAITEYQRRLGITADGIWGPITQRAHEQFCDWLASAPAPTPGPAPDPGVDLAGIAAAINAAKAQVLRNGARGDAVRVLQSLLNNAGAGIAVDGVFGPQTEGAVRAFQGSHGCAVDGVVGPQTWAALVP